MTGNLSDAQAAMRERQRKAKPNQRLSDYVCKLIVAGYGCGVPVTQMAEIFGVSPDTVWRLVRKSREAR